MFAAASILPAQLDKAGVRAVLDSAGRIVAHAFGFPDRPDSRDLRYYLEIEVPRLQREKGIAELKRAVAFAEAGKNNAALQSYDRAAALLPNLGDWVSVFSAGVAATKGDTAEVTRRLEHVDSTLFTDWAWRSRVRAYRNANDAAGAMRLADAAGRLPGSPRRQSEGWRALGEIQLQQGDTAAGASSLTAAIDAWPYSDAALEAARLLSELRGLHPEHHLRIGRTYMRFGNLKRGADGLNAYLASGVAQPDSAAQVRLEMGRAFFDARDYDQAEEVLLQAARSVSPLAANALYLAGRAQYRGGQPAEGRRTLVEVVERYPGQMHAAQALLLLGDLSQDDLELEAARAYFQQATTAAPGTEQAGLAHMRLSAMALSQGDYAAAVQQLNAYRTAFPSGPRQQQALYWLGRSQIGRGDAEQGRSRLREARDLDPYSFYGFRAAELIHEAIANDRLGAEPATAKETAVPVEAALVRIDVLRAVGWNEAANFELDRLRRHFDQDAPALYTLAEGLNLRNRTVFGIAIGRDLLRRENGIWNRRLLRIVYPFPYRELIEKTARSRAINPYFMAALIRQESMFNPTATSAAGARGLMQVMPSTGRSLARSQGIRRFKTDMLYTPEVNVRIGAKFLADMIRTWGGRTDYVLASYNAGPSRMARWRQFPEARDADLFLERIPFDETRDYVRIVQLNARIYETLYGSKGPGKSYRKFQICCPAHFRFPLRQ